MTSFDALRELLGLDPTADPITVAELSAREIEQLRQKCVAVEIERRRLQQACQPPARKTIALANLGQQDVVALCDDGTLWKLSGLGLWEELTPPPTA